MKLRHSLLSMLLLGTGLALAGCETFDLESIWSSKKPLPGERRDMFPQGVPGVQQGIPPDLVQGYQPPQEPPPVAAAPEKPKPARRVASPPREAPPPRQAAPRPQRQQQQVQEEPPQQQAAPQARTAQPQQSGAAWPDPPSRTAQPQQSGPAWPDPPRPGTATR
jgi:hypothetical protein